MNNNLGILLSLFSDRIKSDAITIASFLLQHQATNGVLLSSYFKKLCT